MDKCTKYLESGSQVDVSALETFVTIALYKSTFTIRYHTMYSDFEKAFDKVSHKQLISKLISYGFDSTLINWIQDFLKCRKFRVRVNSSFSLWDAVTSGIPKGSVLGLLYCYLLYTQITLWNAVKLIVKHICLLAMLSYVGRHIVSPNDHCLLHKGTDALQH